MIESHVPASTVQKHRAGSDVPFLTLMSGFGGSYLVLVIAMLAADLAYTSPAHFSQALAKPEIRSAIRLTLISCTISALLSVWVATPLGYLLSRFQFRGRWIIDTLIDVPVVLPPLVIGLSLLILFHIPQEGGNLEQWFQERLGLRITYSQPAVVLAQFAVACAFAVQTMRITFDQIDPRAELVALTLGCRRSQAFFLVVLPQAWRGLIAAFTIAWARSLGEFGPILVFAGATRMRTEVLSTTVFLELSVGQLEAAVAVSLLMVVASVLVLGLVRWLGAGWR
ncbi:ABC transporter permease [Schlesneria sp. DSM 10557]|uniref:ABC transporter permease n=1 Tax=Schlesneria sp. DSM 10557 TaxID=3044399 RepID=UPI0035A0DDE4